MNEADSENKTELGESAAPASDDRRPAHLTDRELDALGHHVTEYAKCFHFYERESNRFTHAGKRGAFAELIAEVCLTVGDHERAVRMQAEGVYEKLLAEKLEQAERNYQYKLGVAVKNAVAEAQVQSPKCPRCNSVIHLEQFGKGSAKWERWINCRFCNSLIRLSEIDFGSTPRASLRGSDFLKEIDPDTMPAFLASSAVPPGVMVSIDGSAPVAMTVHFPRDAEREINEQWAEIRAKAIEHRTMKHLKVRFEPVHDDADTHIIRLSNGGSLGAQVGYLERANSDKYGSCWQAFNADGERLEQPAEWSDAIGYVFDAVLALARETSKR